MVEELERLRADNAALRAKLSELESEVGGAGGGAALLHSVLEAIPAIIIRLDVSQRVRFVNRYMPGYEPESVIGKAVYDFIAPSYVEVVREAVESVMNGAKSATYRIAGSGPDGHEHRYETVVVPTSEPDGQRCVCLVSRDITEEVERERALRTSQEALTVAVAATKMGLWRWDLVDSEVHWSESMRALTGYSGKVTLDAYVDELVHPEDREEMRHFMGELRGGSIGEWRVHRIVRPDGAVRWILPSGQQIEDANGTVVAVVGGSLDVTEQRVREERLRQTQKLEALGALTAGVAHNFNNMLAVISPFIGLSLSHPDKADLDMARRASQAAERAAKLVHQLMRVAGKRGICHRRVCDLNEIVSNAGDICSRVFDDGVRFSVHALGDRVPISCNDAELEQVIVNLCLNARDAVTASSRRPGEVDVLVRRVAGSAVPSFPARRDVAHACAEVRDNGIGMSAQVRARLFEPFFTTKGPDRGTGLGLATSRAILAEHDGVIACKSEPGCGSTFSVYLPLVENAPERPRAIFVPVKSGRALRVLVVDDDDLVRNTTVAMLEVGGHQVVAAASGQEAVALLERGQRFDLVLLDRAMPGGLGTTTIPKIRALTPGVRIAYFTGGDVPEAERALVDGVIQKPIRANELLSVLVNIARKKA